MNSSLAGGKIKQIRTAYRLTQFEFAKKLWTSQEYINKVESGNQIPSGSFLLLVKIIFNLPDGYFTADDFYTNGVSNKIIQLRNEKGLTLKQFADRLCTSDEYIKNIENGKEQPPESFLLLIKKVFGLPEDYFSISVSIE